MSDVIIEQIVPSGGGKWHWQILQYGAVGSRDTDSFVQNMICLEQSAAPGDGR